MPWSAGDDDDIDEIISYGQRDTESLYDWAAQNLGFDPDASSSGSESGGGDSGAAGAAAGAGFVAPQTQPAIERILQQMPKTIRPPVVTIPRATPAIGIPALFALVGGWLAKSVLDTRGQQLLDAEYEKFLATANRVKPDSPLYTIPEVIPEIITTAKRSEIRQEYELPPLPEFYPDFDSPYELSPAVAPRVPLPQQKPKTTTKPLEIPLPQPFRIPQPFARPWAQPWAQPYPMPYPQPETMPRPDTLPGTRPQTQPQVRPAPRVAPVPGTPIPLPFAPPLTSVGPSTLPYAVPLPAPDAQRTKRCPPCKKPKEREEERRECWKKLVKEGVYPSDDESYNWTRIDCFTGREL